MNANNFIGIVKVVAIAYENWLSTRATDHIYNRF